MEVQKEDDSCGKQTAFFSSAMSVGQCVALSRLLHGVALFPLYFHTLVTYSTAGGDCLSAFGSADVSLY